MANINPLEIIAASSIREDKPQFSIGDTIRVYVKIREGERERVQAFEGTVIAKKGSGVAETFTVRRVAYGVGVEKTFPLPDMAVPALVFTIFGYLYTMAIDIKKENDLTI